MLNNEKFNYKIEFEFFSPFHRLVISGKDYSDQNNLPSFFTQNKRGIEKAFEELKKNYKNMTFNEVIRFLNDKKLKVHYYCAID